MKFDQICPDPLETLRVGGYLIERLVQHIDYFESNGTGWKNEITVSDLVALREWIEHAVTIVERFDLGSQVTI